MQVLIAAQDEKGHTMRTTSTGALLLCLVVPLAGCGGNDRAAAPSSSTPAPTGTSSAVASPATSSGPLSPYRPVIVPAEFSTTIDNPFLPLVPGTRLTYAGTSEDGRETIVVDVLRTTRLVMGVRCVVVRDTVSLDGEVIEDTYDWYAQHRDGSVWYFGEDTKELEAGKVVSTQGAWEAGVKGAQPGVVMPAAPAVGDHFRQEYAVGEAEDEFTVLSTSASATLGTGRLTGLVQTEERSRLEPEVVERKYYARGIGTVLVEHVKGPPERIELVKVEKA